MKPTLFAFAILAFVPAAPAARSDDVQDLLSRMDAAAGKFQSMSATVNYIVHTQVIDDDTKESGKLLLKKAGPNGVQARIDFSEPDRRTVIFEGRKVQIYVPKMNTLQIYDLGDKGDQVDRFLMLGFGTSGAELARDYAVRIAGYETIQGKRCARLELLPKQDEVKKLLSKIEMWIPDAPAQPVPIQEKIYEKTPGDYRITAYSDFKLNPKLSLADLKLKTPKGVKIEHPQK